MLPAGWVPDGAANWTGSIDPVHAHGTTRYAWRSGAVGDNQFDKGDMILNRIDLVSELDLIYKERSGLRVSAAAWGDPNERKPVRWPIHMRIGTRG